ncbi:hypothetical protein ITG13_06225 [Vibrio cyclitrophicus]|nr:hypothetical protein [Vibrio cyclitrophicus]UPR48780.1 hypothetical protein ITG13_06225 [Vibrio cyclitrophicus]
MTTTFPSPGEGNEITATDQYGNTSAEGSDSATSIRKRATPTRRQWLAKTATMNLVRVATST